MTRAAHNVISFAELSYGLDGAENAAQIAMTRGMHWAAQNAMARAERIIGLLAADGAPVTGEVIEAARDRAAQPDASRFLTKALADYDAAAERRAAALDELAATDPGCTASTVGPLPISTRLTCTIYNYETGAWDREVWEYFTPETGEAVPEDIATLPPAERRAALADYTARIAAIRTA